MVVMKAAVAALPSRAHLGALGLRLLHVGAHGAARLLDQSMRRPSLAGLLLHSLRVVS